MPSNAWDELRAKQIHRESVQGDRFVHVSTSCKCLYFLQSRSATVFTERWMREAGYLRPNAFHVQSKFNWKPIRICSFHLGLKRPEIGVGIKSKAGVTAGRTAAAAARL